MFIVKLGSFVEFTLSDLRPVSYIFHWTARRHEQSSGQGQAYGSARLDTVLWSKPVTEARLQCPSQDRHLHKFPKKINTKKANTDTIKLDGMTSTFMFLSLVFCVLLKRNSTYWSPEELHAWTYVKISVTIWRRVWLKETSVDRKSGVPC